MIGLINYEVLRTSVKEKVEELLDSYINYEWNGNDFSEEMSDKSGLLLKSVEPTMEFDNELHEKYVNHLTEFIMSGLVVEKE